jgi:translocation protein SEC62
MEQQQAGAPPQVRALVKYLRSSSSGIKIRVGALNGKRHDYFKGTPFSLLVHPYIHLLTTQTGKAAIKALLSPSYPKNASLPAQPTNAAEATILLKSLLPYAFYLLVERGSSSSGPNSPKHLQITQLQDFKADGYYCWFYEGSQLMTYLGGAGLVAVIFAGVMFPLWPPVMRQGVWYLSILALFLLGLLLALAVVRLIIYVITVFSVPPGLWIFPNLFADVGFVSPLPFCLSFIYTH